MPTEFSMTLSRNALKESGSRPPETRSLEYTVKVPNLGIGAV